MCDAAGSSFFEPTPARFIRLRLLERGGAHHVHGMDLERGGAHHDFMADLRHGYSVSELEVLGELPTTKCILGQLASQVLEDMSVMQHQQ